MSTKFTKWRSKKRQVFVVLLVVAVIYLITALVPPPPVINNRSRWFELGESRLLLDTSWQDQSGERVLEQSIFDAVMRLIGAASDAIVLDMFLFNVWQGPKTEAFRALSSELTDALIDAKRRHPTMPVIVITDPVNTIYGGVHSKHLQRLSDADVRVVLTPLVKLQDSNPVYSAIWRAAICPFGNKINVGSLPPPFGEQKVSVRSWLALLNFKANHRKLLITARQSTGRVMWQAVVSSANPHDGSSAHRNVGLEISGDAALALLRTEIELLKLAANAADEAVAESAQTALDQLQSVSMLNPGTLSSNPREEPDFQSANAVDQPFIRVLTEKAIAQSVLSAIDATNAGDKVNVLMFYLSHRSIINALANAAKRGVTVRVLLDANKDAFGRSKNGVPNRPVAEELVDAGAMVRWCDTTGEQCHGKVLFAQRGDHQRLILGSGNYTRRNLDNFNLETNVDIRVRGTAVVMQEFERHFNAQWFNEAGRRYSLDYDDFTDDSWLKTFSIDLWKPQA